MIAWKFASAELIAMGILANIGAPVVQSTSYQLTPPLVRVRRVPGEARSLWEDHAHVEVMCFGDTFENAQALAELCDDTIRSAYATASPVSDVESVTVDHTANILPPAEVPWANPDVRVFQATYLIVTRGKAA